MIIDGKDLVAGRLASKIAKKLIAKEEVIVVNAESIIIIGNSESIMAKFKLRADAAVKSNPHYGPKYDRIPSKMFRRSVKGMLPQKKTTKLAMLKHLKVYNTVPKELVNEKMESFPEIKFNERHNHMTYKEIAVLLGGKW